jgi:hypothetical protein
MSWFSRVTRFGDVHMVFGQERSISCGVACIIMAAFKINKLTPGVQAAFSEADILAKAQTLFGPNPLGSAGLNNPQMVQLLNAPEFGMSNWRLDTLPPSQVGTKIITQVGVTSGLGPTLTCKPVIVGVDWIGGGGHWVLVDTVRTFIGRRYATVCDPWDANVHVTSVASGAPFNYTGQKEAGIDFWGTHYDYTNPSVGGALLGDIIYQT